MEYLIYNQDYLDIPLQDLPPSGNIIICLDPQHRLVRDATWSVLRTVSDNGDTPPKALGLFWDKEEAIFYAESVSRR